MNAAVEISKTEESVALAQHNRFGRKPRWMSGLAAALLQSKTKQAQKHTAQKTHIHGSRPRFI